MPIPPLVHILQHSLPPGHIPSAQALLDAPSAIQCPPRTPRSDVQAAARCRLLAKGRLQREFRSGPQPARRQLRSDCCALCAASAPPRHVPRNGCSRGVCGAPAVARARADGRDNGAAAQAVALCSARRRVRRRQRRRAARHMRRRAADCAASPATSRQNPHPRARSRGRDGHVARRYRADAKQRGTRHAQRGRQRVARTRRGAATRHRASHSLDPHRAAWKARPCTRRTG